MTLEQQIQEILDNIVGSKSKTDRKKEFISLKEAIVQAANNKLLYTLNDKSWSIVLEVVIDFMKSETTNQVKLKRRTLAIDVAAPVKTILLNVLEPEKQINSIFKFKSVISGGAIKFLFTEIFDMLDGKFDAGDISYVEVYGATLAEIVQKMFSNNFYMNRFGIDLFQNYLSFFTTYLTTEKASSVGQINIIRFSHCFQSMVTNYPRDLHSIHPTLFQFFENLFLADKVPENGKIFVLKTLNDYLLKHVQDVFYTARDLGASIGETLITHWAKTNNDIFKTEICQFFRIMMKLKLSENEIPIKLDLLGSLFSTIRNNLDNPRLFSFHQRNKSEAERVQEKIRRNRFFDLAAEVCIYQHLLESRERGKIKLEGDAQQKRMRIFSFEELLLEKLTVKPGVNITDNILNWIIVLDTIISKPSKIPSSFFCKYTSPLKYLLEQSFEKPEIHSAVLHTLQRISEINLDNLKPFFLELVPILMTYVSNTNTKNIDDVFTILDSIFVHVEESLIINHGFLILQSHFFQHSSFVSAPSLRLLQTVIVGLDKRRLLHDSHRMKLLQWLLSYISFSKDLPIFNTVHPNIISTVLHLLICQKDLRSIIPSSTWLSDDIDDFSKEFANLSNLAYPFRFQEVKEHVAVNLHHRFDPILLQTLLQQFVEFSEKSIVDGIASPVKLEKASKALADNFRRYEKLKYFCNMLVILDEFISLIDLEKMKTEFQNNIISTFSMLCKKVQDSFESSKNIDAVDYVEPLCSLHCFKNRLLLSSLSQFITKLNEYFIQLLGNTKTNSQSSQNSILDDDDVEMQDVESVEQSSTQTSRIKKVIYCCGLLAKNIQLPSQALCTSLLTFIDNSLFDTTIRIYALKAKATINTKENILSCIDTAEKINASLINDDYNRNKLLMVIRRIVQHTELIKLDVIPNKLKQFVDFYISLFNENKLSEYCRTALVKLCITILKDAKNQTDLSISNTLLQLLIDECYLIRYSVATNVKLFLLANYKVTDVLEKIKATMEPKDNDDTIARTNLIAVACLLLYSSERADMLFYLLKLYSDDKFSENLFVYDVLKFVAKALGYGRLRELISANLHYILFQWISNRISLTEFPFKLLEQKDLKSFYLEYGSIVFPILIYCNEQIDKVSEQIEMGIEEVYKKYFVSIFTLSVLGSQRTSSVQKSTACIESLPKILGKEYGRLIASRLESILVEMLLFINCNRNEVSFTVFEAERACQFISSKLSVDSFSKLLKHTKSRIYVILLEMFEEIEIQVIPERKLQLFEALSFFIKNLLGENIKICVVLRIILNITLHTLHVECLQLQSGKLLEYLVQESSKYDESASEFGKNLKLIVLTLIHLVQRDHADGEFISQCLRLIRMLTVQCPKEYSSYSFKIDPFPSKPVFEEFKKHLSITSKNASVFDDILFYLDGDLLYDSTILSQLLKTLKERRLEILASNDTKSNSVLLSTLYSKLLRITQGQYDQSSKLLASECIGEFGVFNILTTDKTQEDEFDDVSSSISVSDWRIETYQAKVRQQIVLLLNKLIQNKDYRIVKHAASTLRAILKLTAGEAVYKSLETEDQIYLQPFIPDNVSDGMMSDNGSRKIIVEEKPLIGKVDMSAPEFPFHSTIFSTTGKDHSEWIRLICYCLIEFGPVNDDFLKVTSEMCLYSPLFAEKIFLYLFLVIHSSTNSVPTISELVQKQILDNEASDPRTLRLVISMLNLFARINRLKPISKSVEVIGGRIQHPTNVWLKIPFLSISKAALRAKAPFSSIFYIEAFVEDSSIFSDSLTAVMIPEESTPTYQQYLLEAYKAIDDPDSMEGVNKNYGTNSRILSSSQAQDWTAVLSSYDCLLDYSSTNSNTSNYNFGVVKSFEKLGLSKIPQIYLEGVLRQNNQVSDQIQDAYYENAWKSFQFNIADLTVQDIDETSCFNRLLLKALHALQNGDTKIFYKAVESARLQTIQSFGSSSKLSDNLVKLQMLSELQNSVMLRWGVTSSNDTTIYNNPKIPEPSNIYWCMTKESSDIPVEKLESLMLFRNALLHALQRDDLLQQHASFIADIARKENMLNFAATLVVKYSNQSKNLNLMFEEAKIMWKKGYNEDSIKLAKFIIQQITSTKSQSTNADLMGKVFLKTGKWMRATNTEESETVQFYFSEALNHISNKSKAHFHLAKFFDELYSMIEKKVTSMEWKKTLELRKETDKLIVGYEAYLKTQKDPALTKGPYSAYKKLKTQRQRDAEEDKKTVTDRQRYLLAAMEHYTNAAIHGNLYNVHSIFRLCSLWFTNDRNDSANQKFDQLYRKVPSYKFIPLFYQIASRMSKISTNATTDFNYNTSRLLSYIAREHPYHTLYHLLALKNGDRLQEGAALYKIDSAKIDAAKAILQSLSTFIPTVIGEVEKLVDACIELGMITLDPSKYKNKSSDNLSSSLLITKLKNLTSVPIPTLDLEVNPTAKYQSSATLVKEPVIYFTHIRDFDPTFDLCGGINMPKVIKCLGSDNRKYRLLVKGKDDTRQDAVMEQIFELVNKLLSENKNTRKRNLKIRTYKVIPLAPTIGIIGWVENTMPIADYLVGSKHPERAAHVRYRPADILYSDTRKIIGDAAGKSVEEKHKAYLTVCSKFKPVMHHFFLEKFPNPSEWYQKRENYTKSVAVNSIVGYIIGLGDRHAFNILIDQETAEVVHIDLGVAFEQGKLLPIPELVPFRLTRDIVDGMGITGVEGTFRKCSEATMEVLRHNADLLCNIVEVFVHDPISSWSMSPLKSLNKQRDRSEEVGSSHLSIEQLDAKIEVKNQDAERCILRIREKLRGIENGQSFNVSGQVNRLINQARSTEFLSQMFHGWGAVM